MDYTPLCVTVCMWLWLVSLVYPVISTLWPPASHFYYLKQFPHPLTWAFPCLHLSLWTLTLAPTNVPILEATQTRTSRKQPKINRVPLPSWWLIATWPMNQVLPLRYIALTHSLSYSKPTKGGLLIPLGKHPLNNSTPTSLYPSHLYLTGQDT